MPSRILLALTLVLAGCATFTPTELAQIRERGVRPELVSKLVHRRSLEPADLIELHRAGVPDEQVVRHLEDAGVNYIVTRADVSNLRRSRVSGRVIDSLLEASERFARDSSGPVDYGWYYDDPWAPYFYGDWQFSYGHSWHGGHRGHHGHHGHHRHR